MSAYFSVKIGLSRRSRKQIALGLCLLIVFGLTLDGCDPDDHHPSPAVTSVPTAAPTASQTAAPTATPTTAPTATPTPGPSPTPIGLSFALVGDDGSGFLNGVQIMQVEDATGTALSTPTQNFVSVPAGDIDGLTLTSDGSRGALIDGSNHVYFFTSELLQGNLTVSPNTVDVSQFGGDGDSIATLTDGDEVVVSAGGTTDLALISDILSGTPVIADRIPTSNLGLEYDGVVISLDSKVMLSRSASGGSIDVYSIAPVSPHPGPIGGTVAFAFTLNQNLTVPQASPDGREGMAISPTDSSRAVIANLDNSAILLTGLPTSPTLGPPVTLPGAASATTLTPDGKFAVVAVAGGLVVLGGVDTGALAQVGGLYSPSFPTPSGSCQLTSPTTLSVTPDGKYIVVIQNCSLQSQSSVGSGVLLTIPITAGVLGSPAGQLNYVVTPSDDQMEIR